MGFSHKDTEKFLSLFKCNPRAYGVTKVGEIVNGKAKSESTLLYDTLTLVQLEKHLNGEVSIGASPLLDDSKVFWCAIDIDDYTGDLMNVVKAIEDFNMPLVPCFSKSRKLHIYCFFNEAVASADARTLLQRYLTMFRCSNRTEIFPKQERISQSQKFPSWINLPYFDANNDECWRKSVRGDGSLRSVSEFLEVAEEKCVSYDEHIKLQEMTPFFGAPPCIQSGAILRDVGPGIRNQWFYNVACYLRMTDENIDLEEPILALNETMQQPLLPAELRQTVCKINSTSYFYQCANMIGCDKGNCKKTDKGIGNNTETTGFSFGQLTKVMGDPMYWKWEINGKTLTFHSTDEIMQQNSFRKQCMEKLSLLPYKVKDEKWTSILRRHLETVQEEQVDIRGDFGSGAQLLAAIAMFFAGNRARATNETQVHTGKVYLDENTQEYCFTASALQEYIIEKQHVITSPGAIRDKMQEMGSRRDGMLWRVSVADVPTMEQKDIVVDYHDTEGYDGNGYQF